MCAGASLSCAFAQGIPSLFLFFCAVKDLMLPGSVIVGALECMSVGQNLRHGLR